MRGREAGNGKGGGGEGKGERGTQEETEDGERAGLMKDERREGL